MRQFESGATRDTDEGKFDYEGFLDPRVLEWFARYMHANRHLPDGTMRDSDNWQQGIPRGEYMKSLLRHTMDAWLQHRGATDIARSDIREALCGVLFNAMGYLHEELKDDLDEPEPGFAYFPITIDSSVLKQAEADWGPGHTYTIVDPLPGEK